jgi:4-pyridoxate dehydrogenase
MEGYPRNADYNGASAEGIGQMQMTIRRGVRCSTSVAYLRPALARRNVTLRLRAQATRVLFEGSRAVGIEYLQDGKRHVARADSEILLCGGVINSPQLLMLSGVGDPDQLSHHGISVNASLKGVGRNLHDHLVADVRYRRSEPGTLHRLLRLDRIAVDLLRTYFFGTGLSGNVPATAVGLIRSQPHLASADAHIVFAAGPMDAAPLPQAVQAALCRRVRNQGTYAAT